MCKCKAYMRFDWYVSLIHARFTWGLIGARFTCGLIGARFTWGLQDIWPPTNYARSTWGLIGTCKVYMRLTGHLPYKYHQLVYCLHTSALYSLATETSYFGYPWCCTNVSCQCLYPICEIFDTSVAVNSSNMSRPSDKRTNVGYNFNYMCTPNIADDNNKQANCASALQTTRKTQIISHT